MLGIRVILEIILLLVYPDVEFIGHRVKDGHLMPLDDTIEKIKNAAVPKQRKNLGCCLSTVHFQHGSVSLTKTVHGTD